MSWLRQRLIDDWKQALRWSSVRLHIAAAAIGLVYEIMPALSPSIAAMLPIPLQAKAIGIYAVVGLAFRLSKLKPGG